MSVGQSGPDMSTVIVVALIVVPLVLGLALLSRVALDWFNEGGAAMENERIEVIDGEF